jgi:uncharacterized membrane protein YbhN (UPF0104 family)
MSEPSGWRRKLVSLAFFAVAAGFITRTIVANSRELAAFDWQVRPGMLAVSLAAHVLVLAFGVFVWSKVLPFVGYRGIRFAPLLRIWSLSNAAKYIPGVVWQFLAAARMGASAGLPKVVVVSSMLVHIMLSLISAGVVAVLTLRLGVFGLPPALVRGLRVAIPVAAVLCVHPRVINFGLRSFTRLLRREVLEWEGRWRHGIGLLMLASVSWGAYGVAYFLFLRSLAGVPLSLLSVGTGVNALSFAVGLVVPVPGGLGIRESAMTLLLTPDLTPGVASIVSIGARLWSIVTELALVALGLLVFRPGVNPVEGNGGPLSGEPPR